MTDPTPPPTSFTSVKFRIDSNSGAPLFRWKVPGDTANHDEYRDYPADDKLTTDLPKQDTNVTCEVVNQFGGQIVCTMNVDGQTPKWSFTIEDGQSIKWSIAVPADQIVNLRMTACDPNQPAAKCHDPTFQIKTKSG